eukprot:TRINITY_DN2737_c0_g2_i1.p1 TRINITY_DN2737_c0_g2~~TRINITY_DN2737_c0_g2_i1.p1  ORF type:complete len:376 (+),score=83.74 TRINITY_DN2737_c0_g2_i1:175-1302(+)
MFIPPSLKESIEAIGKFKGKDFNPGVGFFSTLEKPHKGDWLSEYEEVGQDYKAYIKANPDRPDETKTSIYLLPIGEMNERLIHYLSEYVQVFFGMAVKLMDELKVIIQTEDEQEGASGSKKRTKSGSSSKSVKMFVEIPMNEEGLQPKRTTRSGKLSKSANGDTVLKCPITCRFGLDHPKVQAKTSAMLKATEKIVPKDAFCVVGVSQSIDFYEEESDLFICGLAGLNTAVFSVARYDPTFLKLIDDFDSEYKDTKVKKKPKRERGTSKEEQEKKDFQILLKRCMKTISHELLHMFDIEHCVYFKCLMNGTANLDEDDNAPLFVCPVDLRKLLYATKMDISVLQWYENLLTFYKQHDFDEEVEWLEERMAYLSVK